MGVVFSLLSFGQDTASKAVLPSDVIGTLEYHVLTGAETLYEVARPKSLSFPEIMAANPGLDPWVPEAGRTIVLPSRHLLPAGTRKGVVINLAELRLYSFPESPEEPVLSFPIGIGRYAWGTPLGATRVTGKRKNPTWTVPQSILEEDPSWPPVVPPGPDNPLGSHAIYLAMPGYLLHGTNKPWGVGLPVTHGCVRLYPEHVAVLFERVRAGTPVELVNQPVKTGWHEGMLYVEVHVEPDYAREEGSPPIPPRESLYPLAAEMVQQAVGVDVANVDWEQVREAVVEASGIPVPVLRN